MGKPQMIIETVQQSRLERLEANLAELRAEEGRLIESAESARQAVKEHQALCVSAESDFVAGTGSYSAVFDAKRRLPEKRQKLDAALDAITRHRGLIPKIENAIEVERGNLAREAAAETQKRLAAILFPLIDAFCAFCQEINELDGRVGDIIRGWAATMNPNVVGLDAAQFGMAIQQFAREILGRDFSGTATIRRFAQEFPEYESPAIKGFLDAATRRAGERIEAQRREEQAAAERRAETAKAGNRILDFMKHAGVLFGSLRDQEDRKRIGSLISTNSDGGWSITIP